MKKILIVVFTRVLLMLLAMAAPALAESPKRNPVEAIGTNTAIMARYHSPTFSFLS